MKAIKILSAIMGVVFLMTGCSSEIVRCPDGEPVIIVRDVSKVYPFYAKAYDTTWKATVKVLGKLEIEAGVSQKEEIEKLHQKINNRNTSLKIRLMTAFLALQQAPCDKEVRSKFQEMLADINKETYWLEQLEINLRENNEPKAIYNISSQNQSGGITAHTVNFNVNQQRAISSQAHIKKEKREDKFILQVILNQTSGMWDSGTIFKLQVKTSGPYETASIVRGLPSPRFNVRTTENKENGFFAYSTSTAPLKDTPIILEIQSVSDIDLVKLNVEPLAEH